MTPIDFSNESFRNMALRMMDGSIIKNFSLVSAFLPHSNYGLLWRSVIDYRGGVSEPRPQICFFSFREHGNAN